MTKRVGIIGAGISGLACAIELKKLGYQVKVFDSQETVGGRIRTDKVDGFLLDHGFQVFLSSYERAKYFLDYGELELKKFKPGARICSEHKIETLSDPLRDFSSIFATLMNSNSTFKDKFLVLRLKKAAKLARLDQLSNVSSLEFLRSFGFSDKFIENFFIPFFKGIFLDQDLSIDKNFLLYLFDKFGKASASLPLNGMRAIPEQMAKSLSKEELSLSNSVISIGKSSIISQKDAVESFDSIVLAVSNEKLGSFIDMPSNFSMHMHSVSTYYYKTKSTNFASKYLFLAKGKYINHIACLTAVNTNYSESGEQLFSVNVIGNNRIDSRFITEDLKSIFPAQEIDQWSHLKSYHITKALPKKPQFGLSEGLINGIYVAGDHMQSPSIQGALESGYKTAHLIKNNV